MSSKLHAGREPKLKVKLGGLHKKISITAKKTGVVKNSGGRRIQSFRGSRNFSWNLPSNRRRVRYNKQTLEFSSRDNILDFNGNKYRGKLLITFTKKGAKVVNHLGIENYLRGVVGSEMGSLSPMESLKAQTVIARTYAYSNRGKHGRDGADVCDSTHCQVYRGIKSERDRINKAIEATRGIIMVSNGKAIETLYHATCGGMTSDNDKVFGGAPRSYLRRVICPFCKKGSKYRWAKNINLNKLKKELAREQIRFNRLYEISYKSPGLMDRVEKIYLITDKGRFTVKGTTFRRLFKLYSTTFTLGSRKKVKSIISKAIETHPEKVFHAEVKGRTYFSPDYFKAINSGLKIDEGPPQLFINCQKGLKRVVRPQKGWKFISSKRQINLTDNSIKKEKKLPAPKTNRVKVIEKIEIFGRGYGHQVGLCQSGAIEMGKRNWSYRQILPFYYSNVMLRQLKY
ncbi:MAG: SpoIID/LytB domain-containing protein [Candidatus Rifleibacteriota bacterium]